MDERDDKRKEIPSPAGPDNGPEAYCEPLLQTVLDSLTYPFYIIDTATRRVCLANRAARQTHGSTVGTCYALMHGRKSPCDAPDHPCPLEIVRKTKKPVVTEHIHYLQQDCPRNVEVHAFPILDRDGTVTQMIEYCVDVTERKRVAEQRQWELAVNTALAALADALIAPSSSIEETAEIVLEQARRLTDSEHGFVSSIDPETGAAVGHTLTSMMGRQCRLPANRQTIAFQPRPDGSYPALFGHALNTGRGFYTNAPSTHPASTGVPEGHIPLQNFLTAPALVGGAVVGQIAVANSARAYTDRDLESLERMAKMYALAVQRRRAEMALKSSEERYALAQTAADIGSWDWNIVTGRLLWSERIEPMFGFAPGQFDGTYEAFLERVHPDDRQSIVDAVEACIEQGRDYRIDHRIIQPDGGIRWIAETGDVVRDAAGKAVRMLGVVQDITEQKEAEVKIRNLAKFASENPSPVLRLRDDGTILYANRPAQSFLQSWKAETGQAIPEIWTRQMADVLRSRAGRIVEVDCENRTFSFVLVPVTEAGYLNVYGRDVTEQKKAEREIRQLNEQLELRVIERTAELAEANESLREEIQQRQRLERELLEISEREQRRIGQELHDSLGQQLTGIAIMTKVLEQKLRRQDAGEAADAGEIAQLVNEAVSQTRQLSRGLHPVALDEHGLMSALQGLGLTTQRVFGVACEFQCERPVAVKDTAVATHLYRIAQEAVTNAIRHGETSRIVLELTAARDRGALTIENNGRDFPGELPPGEGMGLKVMRYRAEMIGGTLEISPAPAGGTRVTCAFDLTSETYHGEK